MAREHEQGFDIKRSREAFPALAVSDQVFFDNAGGSQALGTVSLAVRTYLESTNVQLGASYNVAQKSTKAYRAGMDAAAKFIKAHPEEIVIGPSTTQLFANISQILSLPPKSEIIISQIDHEANISPWVRMAKQQDHDIKWWLPSAVANEAAAGTDGVEPLQIKDDKAPSDDSEPTFLLTPSTLRPLLSPRTAMVICTHTSNILGGVNPIRAIADELHQAVPSALLCVDGVAYAPHAPIDVQALGADIYAFSWYKVYGPHIAALYAGLRAPHSRVRNALREGYLGHYFHQPAPKSLNGVSGGHSDEDVGSLESKIGLAGASYELVAALPAVVSYLYGGTEESNGVYKTTGSFWDWIRAHEESLQKILLDYLIGEEGTSRWKGRRLCKMKIVGPSTADRAIRVPVISFTVDQQDSRGIVERIEQRSNFACRYGSFYSKRLVDDVLGLADRNGVVRVSLVHYNTVEEISGFVDVLDEVLYDLSK